MGFKWKTPLRSIRNVEGKLGIPPDDSRLPTHSRRLEKQPGEAGYIRPGAAAEPRKTTRKGRREQVEENDRRGRGRRRR